jgi:hypothetical protein
MSDRSIANSLASFPSTIATRRAPARPAAARTELPVEGPMSARKKTEHLYRSCLFGLLAAIGLSSVTPAAGQPACRPVLAFKEVRFSQMRPPTLERTWTAVLSVDASRCATTSGRFAIVFSRSKENAPEIDFEERFVWQPASVEVSVDFWADEAVEGYRLINVAPCPCRD